MNEARATDATTRAGVPTAGGDASHLLVERHGAVMVLTMNRPEAHNALSKDLRDGVRDGFTRFRDDPAARVLVLTGAGDKAFSAGGDLKEMAETSLKVPGPDFMPYLNCTFELDKPVIAAVNGVAFGGGFLLAQMCDLCLAADHARLGITEARWGRGAPWAAAAASAAAAMVTGSGGGRPGRMPGRRRLVQLREVLTGEGGLPFLQLIGSAAGSGDRELEDGERLGEDALAHERLRGEAPLLALAGEQRLGGEDQPGALGDAPGQARGAHHFGEHDLRSDRVTREGPRFGLDAAGGKARRRSRREPVVVRFLGPKRSLGERRVGRVGFGVLVQLARELRQLFVQLVGVIRRLG